MPAVEIAEHVEQDHAGTGAQYTKNIIYGGLDGVITTFSIVAASVGAGLEMKTIITLSVANLVADGLSMGVGDYISSVFENNYINSELNKETYEYDNNKKYEVQELEELYELEGLSKIDANQVVVVLSKPEYKSVFLKHMMNLELGLEIPDNDPKKEGTVTFFSFIISGFIPCLFYIIFYSTSVDYTTSFAITSFVCALTMFLLGIVQAHITKQPKIKGGMMMTTIGVIASGCAFGIGYGLEQII
jgi:VIT1/CCC1 family predicted Fe2+/Mn2+ transporter